MLGSARGACLTPRALQERAAVRTALVLALLACCSCGRTTSYRLQYQCTRQPEGTPELSLELLDTHRRLWDITACVPVTYAPSLDPQLPTLQAALDAWGKVSCSGLCFEPPLPRADAPTLDDDLRLHIADTGADSPGAWELLNNGNTGQTLHATIFVNKDSNIGDVLKQVGFILGFQAGFSRDTVLDETKVPNPRTKLGTLDSQSVCAVYPPCR